MSKIIIEPLRPEDILAASAAAGQAFLTNPLQVAVFGTNLRRNVEFMRLAIGGRVPGQTLVAKDNGQVVGMMRMVESPDCQLPPVKILLLLPIMLKVLGGSVVKIPKWMSAWGKRDPKEHHWHFGPFAVLPDRQRQGIGSQLLTHCCELVDRVGSAAYLETDKLENVRLYQRFGFTVVSEATVVGVHNWFMWRPAQK